MSFKAKLSAIAWLICGATTTAAQSVSVVSAASFDRAVAPESIAAAFGERLATQTLDAEDADPNTPGIQLPTVLGGTTVEINGVRAGLFFVSPGQVNFLVPAGTATGAAGVVVRAGNGATANGTAQVNNVAPAVFSANGTGQGVALATALRLTPAGAQSVEEVARFDALQIRFVTRPLNFGAGNADRVFLILALSGIRRAPDPNGDGNANESVRLLVGGVEITPLYAGRQADFAGLDQLNAELPSALVGRGIVNVVVRVSGAPDTRPVEIELALTASNGALRISDQSITATEDTPLPLMLQGIGSRPPRFTVTTLPRNGRLSGSPPNLTYAPQPDFNGSDDFTFRVNDGSDESSEVRLTILVRPVNDPPVLGLPTGAQLIDVSRELSFDVTITDPDTDQTFTVTAEPPLTGATLTTIDQRRRRFTWTPVTEQGGKIFTVTFRVQDTGDPVLSDTKTIRITVGLLWGKTSGPEGANITALLVDRDSASLFAGTLTGGVYRSLDNGRSWTPINGDLEVRKIYGLYARGTRLFAGTVDGVFYSDNNGQNWRAGFRGLTTQTFAEIGMTLFAGTLEGGVRISTNGGQTWTPANNAELDSWTITNTFVVRGNSLFVAMADKLGPNGGGIYLSMNNGENWTRLRNGLPGNNFFGPGAQSLVANQTHLFAAFRDGSGIYASANNGQTWAAVNNGLTNRNVFALAVNGTTIVAATEQGLFISTNNAQSWTRINTTFANQVVSALAFNAADLLIGTAGGAVFVSPDNGQNLGSSVGFTNSFVTAFALAGTDLYAATDTGVYVSANNGQSYTLANAGLPNGRQIRALAVSGANLLAGIGSGGVFLSTNQRRGWTAMNGGLTNTAVLALTVFDRRVFAGTGNGVFVSLNDGQSWAQAGAELTGLAVGALTVSGNRLYAGTSGGVWVSETSGQSWTSLGLRNDPIHSLAANGNFIVAAARTGNFVSNDGGRNWRRVIAGLDNPVIAVAMRGTTAYAGLEQDGVYALSPDSDRWLPVNDSLSDLTINSMMVSGNNLFVGTTDGVSLSTDSPQTWAAINANLTVLNVDALLNAGGTVFAGTRGGVFSLPEQGQSWTSFQSGLPTGVSISALAASGAALYAGTQGAGAFRSFDQGRNWTAVNDGLANRMINALAAGSAQIAAGTNGGGVYRIPAQGATWEAGNEGLTNRRILALATNGTTLFAGSEVGQIFRSENFGQSWTPTFRLESASREAGFLNVRILAANDGNLFAGTVGASVQRSGNGGQSWTPVAPADLGDRLIATSFAVSGRRFYLGTHSGVFFSTDQGTTWRQINAGLASTYVNGLAVVGDRIYAGTSDRGVFVSRIPN